MGRIDKPSVDKLSSSFVDKPSPSVVDKSSSFVDKPSSFVDKPSSSVVDKPLVDKASLISLP